jgi:hypothetical protein
MSEFVTGIDKFPEGVEILAEKMDLPIPKENMEARKQAVIAFVMGISGL